MFAKFAFKLNCNRNVFFNFIPAGKEPMKEHAAVWIPDNEASTCMHCRKAKFTTLNRRVRPRTSISLNKRNGQAQRFQ